MFACLIADNKTSMLSVNEVSLSLDECCLPSEVLSKTLIVRGLAEKTSAETLKDSFEGAVSARVIADKETGVSKRSVV